MRYVALHASLALGLVACGPGNPIPETDVCRTPASTASLTAVSARHVSSAEPLADGEVLPFTVGGQGTTMIGLELILEGSDVPGCAAQMTTLVRTSDGTEWAWGWSPIATYERPDGSHVSGEMWIIPSNDAAPGTEATLRVESYGVTSEVDVFLDRYPER